MAKDPRTFFVKDCKTRKAQTTDAQKRKDFFGALGKVGDLEILNDIGFGKVAEGLRVLNKTSNSIRTGTGALPAGVDDSTGEAYVLDQVGINPNAARQATSFNPGVANRAYGQAQAIYEKVKQGEFELSDIPETFSDLQNLSALLDGIFTESPSDNKRDTTLCHASPYAVDLIARAPKYKFLFVAEFIYNEGYSSLTNMGADYAFVIKNSTRPNVDFEYEEVNMYNFWTQVPKRARYQPMTMRFYDDNLNSAMLFYNSYLKAMSPIANVSSPDLYALNSMNFQNRNSATASPTDFRVNNYSASLGPLIDDATKTILREIRLYHVYQYGELANVYHFFNPRITNLELDELDMAENGNGSEASIQFNYDGMYLETGFKVTSENLIAVSSGGVSKGMYPLKPVSAEEVQRPPVTDPGVPTAQDQGIFGGVKQVAQTATGAVSSAINTTTGLISNAFTQTSNFVGSIFTDET